MLTLIKITLKKLIVNKQKINSIVKDGKKSAEGMVELLKLIAKLF